MKLNNNTRRPQKQIIKHIGFHLLVQRMVEEKKKKADGTEETIKKLKFVREGELFTNRGLAQNEGVRTKRPYRVVGVRIDATPVVVTRERSGGGEVTITRES